MNIAQIYVQSQTFTLQYEISLATGRGFSSLKLFFARKVGFTV